jgi:hypothetical protein
MPDQTINQPCPPLKDLNRRLKKLGRKVDELDILAYRYQRLSALYRKLAETLDHIDVASFEIRQEFDQIKELYERIGFGEPHHPLSRHIGR